MMFERACGERLVCDVAGAGASGGSCGGDWAFPCESCGMRCPERRSGSGTLDVSRVCDMVVMCARSGRDGRAWNKHCRAERAMRAIVVCAMACEAVLGTFRCGVAIEGGNACQGALVGNFWQRVGEVRRDINDFITLQHTIQAPICLRTSTVSTLVAIYKAQY
jgi:hypothetical protein